MDELKIYGRTGTVKLTACIDEGSMHDWGIMEDNRLSLTFYAEQCVLLLPGDWVEFDGARFWLTEEYKPQQEAEAEWKYDLTFGGVEALLAQTLVLDTTDGADRPLFVLTAPAREHMTLIVGNINRRLGTTQWKVGEVLPTENIEIDYSGKSCTEALAELAEACKTEWWADGITLNLSRCEFGEAIELGYGRGLSAEIECSMADNLRSYAYLYPVGSTRNIDPQKYGHDRLQLPDGRTRVDMNPEQGFGEMIESAAFEDIYPRYVGEVYSVLRTSVTDDEGNAYYIYRFDDRSLPFNPNDYEIAGLVKRVTFQSGELAGREFEVNYDPDWDGGMFEIITQWPYNDDTQLPGGLLVPKPGDKYVIWNIRMPDEYYPRAEQEFLEAAEKFASEARRDVSVYKAPLDFIDVQERGLVLRPGQRVRLLSEEYFPEKGYYDSRITRISQPVLYPDEMSVEISAVRSKGFISRIQNEIKAIQHSVKLVSSEYPDLIRSWEDTPASDTTVYTARKSEREFLNRRRGGTVEALVRFRQGIVSDDYRSGALTGSGWGAGKDANGDSVLEVDKLFVRKEAVFNELVINQTTFRIGATVFSNGGCELTRIGDLGSVYRCYYDNKEGRRYSGLVAGDQVRCQRYDANRKTIVKYYWRLVVAVGEDYVDLSKSDADGAGIPEVGDEIAQFGNRTDRTRQSAIVIDPLNGGSVEVFAGIDSFNLSDKNYVGIGVNPSTGRAYSYAYGDMFYGDRDLSDPDATFITFQKKEGEDRPRVHIKADLVIGAGSSGLRNLSEWNAAQDQIDHAAESAANAEQTAQSAQQAADEAARKAQEAKDYINDTLPDEFAAINRKLDGVVENWFYPYTPSLTNEPARSWIESGAQEQHLGDTFTNTQSYVDNQTTPDAGKAWRWVKEGSTYKWTPIADSDAVKALQEAANAQDTADGKSRIFVVQPTTPYEVGDLWPQGASGDVMRCIKSRLTGSFDASDWDKASKYTDDTVAKEAKQDAKAAQQTADKAKTSADSATDTLTTWASDNYISPQEKTALRQQQKDIQSEANEIAAQAAKYSISVSAFRTAYNAANAALAKYTAANPESIPIDADYANIAAYYTARQTILEAIAAAAKEYSEKLVADVQVSSRNLIPDSQTISVAGYSNNYMFATRVLTVQVSGGDELALNIGNIEVLEGAPQLFEVVVYDSSETKQLTAKAQLTTDNRSYVFKVREGTATQTAKLILYAGQWGQTAGKSVRYTDVSLVRGNRPMPVWMEAPEDAQKRVDAARQIADKAQQTADNAKASADSATDTLTTWASDNYISPQEKTALRQQQKDIQSEANEIAAQAAKYSISVSAFRTAYNAANAALARYTAASPESIPIDADYANIAAYYTARQTILEAIAAAAKEYSEKLVEDVQPTGDNLLRHTKDFTKGWTGTGEMTSQTYNGLTVYYGKSTVNYKEIRQQNVALLPSTEYTLSFWAKGVGQIHTYCFPYVNELIVATNGNNKGYVGRDTANSYDLTSEWKRYWVTFRTYPEAKGGSVLFRVMVGSEAYVCGAKIAQGNKGIVWTASPEDAESSGTNIIDDTESRTITADAGNNYAQVIFPIGAVRLGDTFALSIGSIELLSGTATKFTAILYDYGNDKNVADWAELTTDSRTAVYTVQRASEKTYLILYAGLYGSTAGNSVRYNEIMLTRGNKPALTWSPSPADVQQQIDAAKIAAENLEFLKTAFAADDTVISGGLVVSSFMGVKNSSKAVVAGMAGKNFLTGKDFAPNDETCPWLFGGAASAAAANSAITRFYMNGKFYSNDAVISGTITAKSGSFGDFKIDGLYLTSSHSEDHGTRLGDGAVVNWGNDNKTTMFAIGATLNGIMPSGQGFSSAAAQFVSEVKTELPYDASVAYYAYMANTYGKKAYAFLANGGDIETIAGVIEGHIHYRTMAITGSGHMIGGAVAGKEQLFVMKNTSTASIYLPPSVSSRIGEMYYVVQCSASATYIWPNNGSSDKIKDSSGTVINRHVLSENQSCSIMWDGGYWRILPF